jgi:signal transduction histidine kinase
LGLLGIQERTSLVGGTVQIESQPGTGTRLLITVPFLDKLLETNEDPGDRIVYELAGDVFTEEMPTRET